MTRHPVRAALAVIALVVAMTPLLTTPANAYDGSPCHTPVNRTLSWNGYTYPNTTTKYCPLTSGTIPVYEWSSTGAPVVGYLVGGDSRNWFINQKKSNYAARGQYWNTHWASTMADNGRYGWVPEIYFRGGNNDEADRGLLWQGSWTCWNSCNNIPPWGR